jgi:hypothetical protein
VGVEGLYVKTENLQRNYNLNLPAPTLRTTDVDPAQRPFFGIPQGVARPITQLGNVTVRESTAHSVYKALSFSVRVQKKWGQLNAYYVLSDSKSDDDNERDAGGFTYENAFNLAPEYNYANLDRRHQVNGYLVIFLPKGFEFASGFRYGSARPFDARLGRDANGDTNNLDRPYSAPGVPFLRNAFRNYSETNIDIRMQKTFTVAGKNQIVLSVDAFNVFGFDNVLLGTATTFVNYCTNVNDPTCGFSGPTNPTFGQVKGADGKYLAGANPGPPRQWQIGLRYRF